MLPIIIVAGLILLVLNSRQSVSMGSKMQAEPLPTSGSASTFVQIPALVQPLPVYPANVSKVAVAMPGVPMITNYGTVPNFGVAGAQNLGAAVAKNLQIAVSAERASGTYTGYGVPLGYGLSPGVQDEAPFSPYGTDFGGGFESGPLAG